MSTISASTTLTTAFNVTGDTTGTLVFQTGATPTTALTIGTNQVATFAQAPVLPAASIPQAALAAGVAGNGPAFSAYMNANQSLSNQTSTKLQYNTEEYDTASCYDTSTYRFLPLVAGYYSFTAAVQMANSCAVVLYVQKNGIPVKSVSTALTGTNSQAVNATVYLNGSTDYIELYCYQSSGGSLNVLGTAQWSYFQGFLARAA